MGVFEVGTGRWWPHIVVVLDYGHSSIMDIKFWYLGKGSGVFFCVLGGFPERENATIDTVITTFAGITLGSRRLPADFSRSSCQSRIHILDSPHEELKSQHRWERLLSLLTPSYSELSYIAFL